jgi:hypothetical protein
MEGYLILKVSKQLSMIAGKLKMEDNCNLLYMEDDLKFW